MIRKKNKDTLKEARKTVERLRSVGVSCPCCGQRAQTYKRNLYSAMGAWLVLMVRKYSRTGEPMSIHDLPAVQGRRGGGDGAKLKHWGLIEAVRVDDLNRTLWRPTKLGIRFATGRIRVPKTCWIFDGHAVEVGGDRVHIDDVLGEKCSRDTVWLWGS